MLNTAAGIGLAQLDRMEELLSKRKDIHQRYRDEIATTHGLFSIELVHNDVSQIIGCFGCYLKMLMLQTTSLNSLKICRFNPGYFGDLSHFLPLSKCWPNMTCNIANLYHQEW